MSAKTCKIAMDKNKMYENYHYVPYRTFLKTKDTFYRQIINDY